jgi:hypothetical protein
VVGWSCSSFWAQNELFKGILSGKAAEPICNVSNLTTIKAVHAPLFSSSNDHTTSTVDAGSKCRNGVRSILHG